MDNTAFFKLSYGLFVVTAHEGDKDNGCITNTVVQQTITPNRISVTINKNNYTHDMIKRTGVFNVSVLSEKAKFETFKHWGFQSGKEVDKAVDITFSRADNGVIYITDKVYGPTDYTAGTAPAYISKTNLVMKYAIYNGMGYKDGKDKFKHSDMMGLNYYAYLKAMQSDFA